MQKTCTHTLFKKEKHVHIHISKIHTLMQLNYKAMASNNE